MRKSTKEEFVRKARLVHGNKYDYSLVNYITNHIPVKIICPIHGVIEQTPANHLRYECYKCGKSNAGKTKSGLPYQRKTIKRKFINDCNIVTREIKKVYNLWIDVIRRCYDIKFQKDSPSYKGCSVDKEWYSFSNFKRWFDDKDNGYHEGYQLDKDILVKGNKVYGPDTCCFVPPYINTLIISNKARRGEYPIGVTKVKNGYLSQIRKNRKLFVLGRFENVTDAFFAYKKEKEEYIKAVAREYYNKGLITEKLYNALNNYTIDITD